MGEIKDYKDLVVWRKAHQMALLTIELVESFPRMKSLDCIGPQLLSSATSVSANIAEGYGSFGKKEYSHYLKIALKSAYETRNWLDKLTGSRILRPKVNIDLVCEIESLGTEVTKMLITLIGKLEGKH